MVKYHEGRSNFEGAIDVDSDCEEGASEGASKTEEENQEHGRAIFPVGSFSAYEPSTLSIAREMTSSSAGNHSSSIFAPTRSHSPPSNRRVQTLA